MTSTEDIRDIFSILHDGTISAYDQDNTLLTLTIDCQYLAERINGSFEKFFVEFTQVDELSFSTWPNPFDSPVKILTELSDIFEAKLQILSAEIKDGKVIIACNQHDTDFDYCGGFLTIRSKTVRVFDQDKRELMIDEFDLICKRYWREMPKN